MSYRKKALAHPSWPHRHPAGGLRVTAIDDDLMLLSMAAPEPPGGGLSRAEHEVSRLALRGLSNAAIADARRSSPRTVANQLAAVYRKLGVTSRRELRARISPDRSAEP